MMKEVLQQAITLLKRHSNEDFVSRADSLKASNCLQQVMDMTDHWHWIEHVLNEVSRAEEKYPNWPKDKIYALAIVGEEYGEAQREAVKLEMNEGDKSLPNLKKELIQTAATCIRSLKNL